MSSEHWKSHAKDVDRDDATLPNHHLTQMRGHSQANRLPVTSPIGEPHRWASPYTGPDLLPCLAYRPIYQPGRAFRSRSGKERCRG